MPSKVKKAVKRWRMSKSTSSNGLTSDNEHNKPADETNDEKGAMSDSEVINEDGRHSSLSRYFKRTGSQREASTSRKSKPASWTSIATIVLVEGKDLTPMDDNGLSDPYVKFQLGNEKFKSKWKSKTLTPKWIEQFDFRIYPEVTTTLELSVYDHDITGKDDFMGKATLNLIDYKTDYTHRIDCKLDDNSGIITFLLSITALAPTAEIFDTTIQEERRLKMFEKYKAKNSVKEIGDVGWLNVKVIKAQNLSSADINGKSDPFCIVELVNDRLQTHTEYKTLCPEWDKTFTFDVKDVHSILEVSVWDEDRDKKMEFLGMVAIPIVRIRNKEKRWYQLKDKKLMKRVKGGILLELDLIFNHFKAAIRTFNPREDKYMKPPPKFKLTVMKRNIDRVSKIGEAAAESGKFIQSCFTWKSKPKSAAAFATFLIIVWNFQLYLLPLSLLIVFIKNLLVVHLVGNLMKEGDDEYADNDDDDEEDDKKSGKAKDDEKKSFKDKIQQVQEICLQVQEGMDMAASMGERVKNTFNWTVPWLSWLAVVVLGLATVGLYYIPIRYIILAWGINKFTKKLRKPDAIDNNELMDYLSRVPSDKELIMYRELRPDPCIGTMKKKKA